MVPSITFLIVIIFWAFYMYYSWRQLPSGMVTVREENP